MENVGGSVTGVTRIRNKKERDVVKKCYECVAYRKYGKTRCVCHNIKEDMILANLKNYFILLKERYIDEINHLKLEDKETTEMKNLEKEKLNLKSLEEEYKVLILQRVKEITNVSKDKKEFIENMYKSLEEEKYKEIERIRMRLQELQDKNLEIKQEQLKKSIDYFNQIIEKDSLDKTILNILIDRIYIYHDQSIRFELKINAEKLL